MKKTMLYNGEIITVNKDNDIKEAIIWQDNRILFVGSNEDALLLCDDDTEKIDLQGKSVLPGFIETHMHTTMREFVTKGLDLSYKAGATNIKKFQEMIAEYAKTVPEDQWILGHSLNFEDFEEHRWPTRFELDEISTERPIVINHCSAHTGVYNTKALELCGIFTGIFAEHVMKDENGEITGVLKENAHFGVAQTIRKYNSAGGNAFEIAIRNLVPMMLENGITSVHDAGGSGTTTVRAMQKLAEEKVNMRFYPMLYSVDGKEENIKFVTSQIQSGFFTGLGGERMKIGPLKLMVDGSGASGTCATREPVSNTGVMMPTSMEKEEVFDLVEQAHKAGFQITAHCIGDRAIELLLDAYKSAQEKYPRENCRHRIEHCMIAEEDLLDRIKEQEVIPTFNPAFINQWGLAFNKYYKGSRNDYLIPLKSAFDRDITCTIASDWECIPDMSPLKGIASAMDREVYATGECVSKNQAIGLMDAIRCYTYNAAYAEFSENEKGSLEVGKLADIIVLESTITKASSKEISTMKVEKTYFDGKLAFEKQA